jgi:hypothetical protein
VATKSKEKGTTTRKPTAIKGGIGSSDVKGLNFPIREELLKDASGVPEPEDI